MTTFTPTHRTNRAIGKIKSGSLIRVAQYDDSFFGLFSHVLWKLGIDPNLVSYNYYGGDVMFREGDRPSGKMVLPNDYVITDGETIEVSDTDSGWYLLPARKVSGTEEVNISFHETYYCLYGAETDKTLNLTPDQLRDLSAKIEDALPEVSPIEDARFIHAFLAADIPGEYRTLAKVDGRWYDHNGEEYTEEQVLYNYDEIEVIR